MSGMTVSVRVLVGCMLFAMHASSAQDLTVSESLQTTEDLPESHELRILSPTLAPEQIDRAVLNRLMQEILDNPESTAANFLLQPAQLHDMLTLLSNAHGFINDNDIANIRAMCAAWDKSQLTGDARIREALAAYDKRAQFTKDFIAKYYNFVLGNIQAELDERSLSRFQSYMDDRRRRMASAGAVVTSAVSGNIRSGEESIQFHCRIQ